jgi:hypothetical protein
VRKVTGCEKNTAKSAESIGKNIYNACGKQIKIINIEIKNIKTKFIFARVRILLSKAFV